jgi:hypothetical protein
VGKGGCGTFRTLTFSVECYAMHGWDDKRVRVVCGLARGPLQCGYTVKRRT